MKTIPWLKDLGRGEKLPRTLTHYFGIEVGVQEGREHDKYIMFRLCVLRIMATSIRLKDGFNMGFG